MKQTILVVDDEADMCKSLQERLMGEGYKVLTASDGRRGLRVYNEHLVDLVITDVLMPELDGLEVVRTLRGIGAAVPIIAMSGGGNRDLDFLVEAAEFGATRTISKPFRLEELIVLVHDLLDSIPHHAV
ncbi:MAG: response regulator [Nitrospirota bacterium]|nr:MAG: response regulator [Nitrospirota bacterium]